MAGVLIAAVTFLVDPVWTRLDEASSNDVEVANLPFGFSSGQPSEINYLIPGPLDRISRPPAKDTVDVTALGDWLVANKAVAADRLDVNFIVRTDRTEPTIITNARVVVVSRSAPVQGLQLSSDTGGNQPVRVITADLDASPPVVGKPISWNFPLRISQADPEIFTVAARTRTCNCEWVIELDVIDSADEPRTVTIDDHGQPFRVTSSVAASTTTSLPATSSAPWPA